MHCTRVLLAAMLATAFLSPTAALAAQISTARPADEYKVGPGERLRISVYNADKLTGEYPVGPDGAVAMPMLGRVVVKGLTLDQVATLLTTRLADGYLQHPNVSVDIAAYRSVYILGEVTKPGQYAYVPGLTIFQLVAQAGGFTYRANRSAVKLRHEDDPRERKYKVSSKSPVAPGDTVVVMQRYF